MKFYCDIEGFKDNWAEVSDSWTRKEYSEMMQASGEDLLKIMQHKVLSCFVVLADGSAATSFGDITDAQWDEMDLRLFGWIGGLLPNATERLRLLGNQSARLWSKRNVAPEAPAQEK